MRDSWASRLHPEDKERTLDAFGRRLSDKSGATGYDIEYRLRGKDEQFRWFRARGQTKRAKDGTPLRAVGMLSGWRTSSAGRRPSRAAAATTHRWRRP